MSFKIVAAGLSDPGLVRQSNEDIWIQVPELALFALADGMGGHRAGEIASREAVHALSRLAKKAKPHLSLYEARDVMAQVIKQVNHTVYNLGRSHQQLKGMGTTLCCMQFREDGIVYGHVGDSRIYRLRRGTLEQLTQDHSLLRELIDLGQIAEGQGTDFLYKNILTRAIGTEPQVEPSVYTCDLAAGDLYLMCTDGLSDVLSEREMESILNSSPSVESAVKALVDAAKKKGGFDNITVVIMRVEAEHES